MKRILIIGASSGIGAAVAEHLASQVTLSHGETEARGSVELILHGRDEERLKAVAQACTADRQESVPPLEVTPILGDVVDWAEDVKSIPSIEPVDAVVWSAGVCELSAGQMLNLKTVRRTLSVNLEAPLVVLSHFYRKGIIRDGGTIVLLGSQSAHDAGEGFSVYAASKGGLASAARVLGKEFARKDIQVHCLEPGTVDTPMTKKLQAIFSGRGTHPSLAKNANFGGQARDEGHGMGEPRLGDADYPMLEASEVAAKVARILISHKGGMSPRQKGRDPA